MIQKVSKAERHRNLLQLIEDSPFLTDEELARTFQVSLPTIRLDRMELNIKEFKERVKSIAADNLKKIRSVSPRDIVGEIVDITPGNTAVAVLETTGDMAFTGSDIIRGNFIYSFAETLAIALIDADVALVGVANIKYKLPVRAGAKLAAYAQVRDVRGNKHTVWVFIKSGGLEVFRGKFILAAQ